MGFSFPCDNINYTKSARSRTLISHMIIINTYFNHNSYTTRKRWNKSMKIKNWNQPPKSKNLAKKEKLYHKVATWNKQNSHMASDKEKFPVIQRAILKY